MSAPSTPARQLPDYLAILLDPYRNHPIVGDALVGAGPDAGRFFGWLYGEGAGRFDMLSGGEQATFDLALSLWNGRSFDLARLHQLDDSHRLRAATAIQACFSPLWGKE